MSTNYNAPEPELLARFFSQVGAQLTAPAIIRFYGGSAVRWLGSPIRTQDFDYEIAAGDAAELRRIISNVARELRLDVEEDDASGFMPLPPGAENRHQFVGTYGQLEVYILDPYAIALQKLERGATRDIEAVRFLLNTGRVDLAQLEQFAGQVSMDDRPQFEASLSEIKRMAASQPRLPRIALAVLIVIVVLVLLAMIAALLMT